MQERYLCCFNFEQQVTVTYWCNHEQLFISKNHQKLDVLGNDLSRPQILAGGSFVKLTFIDSELRC